MSALIILIIYNTPIFAPMPDDKCPKETAELTLEAKEAIRSYLIRLIAPPAIIISVLSFFLGFIIREGAQKAALADALKDITPKTIDAIVLASASAEKAKQNAQIVLGKIARQLSTAANAGERRPDVQINEAGRREKSPAAG